MEIGSSTIETLRIVRQEFEQGLVDKDLLITLYCSYTDVSDTRRFVEEAIKQFPHLNCGLASLYLQHRLGEGVVTQGQYDIERHTFLMLGDCVADITADQYGGPAVYLGSLQAPWRLTADVLYA